VCTYHSGNQYIQRKRLIISWRIGMKTTADYRCNYCDHTFSSPLADVSKVRCPNCGSARVEEI
jgi:DNA-directed RNA polymerase subunit RPC12/RpoP